MEELSSEKSRPEEYDFKLISEANDEFNSGDYDNCLETLRQLEEHCGSGSKLRHNRAVVEFYKSECKDHSSLLRVFTELDSTGGANKTKASPLVSCLSPIARYNKAVIYFHRHMHRSAIETLALLVDNLDSLEESIALPTGVLMLHLLLATNQWQRAQSFLEVLQNVLGINAEAWLAADDAAIAPNNATSQEGFMHTFKLLALHTNVLNHRVVVVPESEDRSPEFAALKAHQYYIMKDFQMAAKQLQRINIQSRSSADVPGDELNTCIANNMGVIHLRVRHYAIAAKFFQNAIVFDKRVAANLRNVPLHHMSAAHSCEILYNLGISMLHLRRPKEAFQCFLVPLKSYHSNPRLWFRLAEACIMEHEMRVLEEDRKPLVTSVITVGARRKYMLKPTPKRLYDLNNQSAAVPEPNLEFAALSLRNALTLTSAYIRSCSLDGKMEEARADISGDSQSQNIADNNYCNPSQPVSKKSLENLRAAIYAAYSYVSLRLGDYVRALEMAQELLKTERLSDAHKMLAHMYAGEALIMLDRSIEARPHLEPSFVSMLNAFDFETKDWQVKSLDAANNIVRYNLAVVMVLQGNFEMAKTLLVTCTHPIVASKTVALKIYLDIRMGKGT